jgi:hypothetical protein
MIEADPSVANPDHTPRHIVGDVCLCPKLSPFIIDLDPITAGQLSRFRLSLQPGVRVYKAVWRAWGVLTNSARKLFWWARDRESALLRVRCGVGSGGRERGECFRDHKLFASARHRRWR